jgi:hypothetical protein
MSDRSEKGVSPWVWYLVFVAACIIGRYLLDEQHKRDIARQQVERILGPAPKWDTRDDRDPYPW